MKTNTLKLNKEEKYIFLRSLTFILSLSKSHKSKDSRKKLFLEAHMKELGIPLDELQHIKSPRNAESIVKDLKSITNLKVKKYIFRDMILLAIADHELTDNEISTIYQIGAHSGIKEEKISDFFLWAAKGIEWEIEGMNLLEEDV